jgi:hypothetical protein
VPPRPLPLLLLGAFAALGCGARCAPSRQGAAAGGAAAGGAAAGSAAAGGAAAGGAAAGGAAAGGAAAGGAAAGGAATSAEARAPATAPAPPPGPVRWLKGALHAHSNYSGDSHTPPAEVARWYAEHGYDFLVLTDHNRIAPVPDGPLLVIPGVELTAELPRCEPPSDGTRCPLHVGAWFANPARQDAVPPRPDSIRRVDIYGWWLDVARALEGLAVIHHPNYEYGADAEVLTELSRRGARFVEIANESVDANSAGDATHPSVEALWDVVLSRGLTLYGVASDDAHHYDDAAAVADAGETAFTGDRGFVVVRAARDPASIRAALERGDFYASSGVRLARVEARPGDLEVEVAPATPGDCEVRFVGAGGKVLHQANGRRARFLLAAARGGYVRAVITDASGRRAWTQPVRVP